MRVTVYEHIAEVPELTSGSFFHSKELMALCVATPRHKPYMAVVTDDDGQAVAHMLALVYSRRSWLPPYLYSNARVLGEGVYRDGPDDKLFGMMSDELTKALKDKVLYIEFSHFSQKMFGYSSLRNDGYFHVRWMNIHNSLHSRTPEERITQKEMQRIKNATDRGATTKEVETEEEFQAFSKLLRRHHWLKPRRFIPDNSFFRGLKDAGRCKIFITQYRDKVIGCTVCVYDNDDAYLWYSAARRKSFAPLHPNAVTYWATIKDAHQSGCQHIRFVDVGLPFKKSPYRDFILRFGGKEVSAYRWFRISIKWMNSIAKWLWRE